MLDMKKVELHLHLEGAAPPAFVRQLAQEKNTSLEGMFDDAGNYTYSDFWDFLKVYEAVTELLTTPRDFERLTTAVLEQSAASNVIYSEVFISPDFCGGRDVGAWREYLAAIGTAAAEARATHGIEMRAIVTCIRHFGPERAREAAICAAETAGDFVMGFGMAGDELTGRARDYAWSFECAREAGLHLTAHAGEWSGPNSVRDVIRDLGVERVGHGVRAIEDPALVQELVDKDIVLEVCPISNVVLGVFPSMQEHPINALREAGVKVTVSTDDPPYFKTSMDQEYAALDQTFGWGEEGLKAVTRAAAEAAFVSRADRKRLLEQLEEA